MRAPCSSGVRDAVGDAEFPNVRSSEFSLRAAAMPKSALTMLLRTECSSRSRATSPKRQRPARGARSSRPRTAPSRQSGTPSRAVRSRTPPLPAMRTAATRMRGAIPRQLANASQVRSRRVGQRSWRQRRAWSRGLGNSTRERRTGERRANRSQSSLPCGLRPRLDGDQVADPPPSHVRRQVGPPCAGERESG